MTGPLCGMRKRARSCRAASGNEVGRESGGKGWWDRTRASQKILGDELGCVGVCAMPGERRKIEGDWCVLTQVSALWGEMCDYLCAAPSHAFKEQPSQPSLRQRMYLTHSAPV